MSACVRACVRACACACACVCVCVCVFVCQVPYRGVLELDFVDISKPGAKALARHRRYPNHYPSHYSSQFPSRFPSRFQKALRQGALRRNPHHYPSRGLGQGSRRPSHIRAGLAFSRPAGWSCCCGANVPAPPALLLRSRRAGRQTARAGWSERPCHSETALPRRSEWDGPAGCCRFRGSA